MSAFTMFVIVLLSESIDLFVTVAVEVAESNLELPPLLGRVKVFEADSECGAPISVCA